KKTLHEGFGLSPAGDSVAPSPRAPVEPPEGAVPAGSFKYQNGSTSVLTVFRVRSDRRNRLPQITTTATSDIPTIKTTHHSTRAKTNSCILIGGSARDFSEALCFATGWTAAGRAAR